MFKVEITVPVEDVRRALNLPPQFTITGAKMVDGEIVFNCGNPLSIGIKPTRTDNITEILQMIHKAAAEQKEIIFEYYNDNKTEIEITNRKFLPSKWINEDCIEGYDFEKNSVRRFCPSRMNWVESVVTL